MDLILHPWQLLLIILASWVNRQQQHIIDFQRAEVEILKEKLGKQRILLNDNQTRRRLAVKAKVLGRKVLEEIGTLFTPDTILRWHPLQFASAKQPQFQFPVNQDISSTPSRTLSFRTGTTGWRLNFLCAASRVGRGCEAVGDGGLGHSRNG